MMSRISSVFIVCLLLANLSGCALTREQITIEYVEQPGVAELDGAHDIIVDVNITDNRADKSKVSCKKNGYGMEMAPITASEEVSLTIKKAIEKELLARGFEVGVNNAVIHISADLTRFYNDHKMGFFAGDAIAEINLLVVVNNKNGDQVFYKQIIAQGIEENTQLSNGKNAKRALEKALHNTLQILFADHTFLNSLIKVS